MTLDISDSKINRDDILLIDDLTEETKLRCERAEILIIPQENLRDSGDRAFVSESSTIYKQTKGEISGFKIEFVENLDQMRYSMYHADEIWLGTFLVTHVAFPLFISFLGNYIFDKFKNKPNKKESMIHLEIIVEDKNKGISKSLKFDGNPDEFEKKFTKINLNKIFGE